MPDKISTRLIPIKQSNPQRPPVAEFDASANEWLVRTEYPKSNPVAGTYTVLCADGSVKRRTLDNEGNIIQELLVKAGDK